MTFLEQQGLILLPLLWKVLVPALNLQPERRGLRQTNIYKTRPRWSRASLNKLRSKVLMQFLHFKACIINSAFRKSPTIFLSPRRDSFKRFFAGYEQTRLEMKIYILDMSLFCPNVGKNNSFSLPSDSFMQATS